MGLGTGDGSQRATSRDARDSHEVKSDSSQSLQEATEAGATTTDFSVLLRGRTMRSPRETEALSPELRERVARLILSNLNIGEVTEDDITVATAHVVSTGLGYLQLQIPQEHPLQKRIRVANGCPALPTLAEITSAMANDPKWQAIGDDINAPLPQFSVHLRGRPLRTMDGISDTPVEESARLPLSLRKRIASAALEGMKLPDVTDDDLAVATEHVYMTRGRIELQIPSDHPLQQRLVATRYSPPIPTLVAEE